MKRIFSWVRLFCTFFIFSKCFDSKLLASPGIAHGDSRFVVSDRFRQIVSINLNGHGAPSRSSLNKFIDKLVIQ